jgi:hypothetical protein
MMNAFMGADAYTAKEFSFDRDAGMVDPHVAEYAQLAAADKAAGTYDKSMAKLVSFMLATRNALRERTTMRLTDDETQVVVGIVGRMHLVLDIMRQTFPEGIPAEAASEINDYMVEINDLIQWLMNIRQNQATEIAKQAQVQSLVEKGEIPIPSVEEIKAGIASGLYPSYAGTTQKEWLEWALTSGYYPTYAAAAAPASITVTPEPVPSQAVPGVPGGGVAVTTPTKRKFPVGPVVAVGAGLLATWLALR